MVELLEADGAVVVLDAIGGAEVIGGACEACTCS